MEKQFLDVNFPIDLLALLAEKELQNPLSIRKRSFDKYGCIYCLDDPASNVYVVKKGRIKVESIGKDDRTIIKNIYSEGGLFGEVALMEETSRVDFATAMEKTELYTLSPEDFYMLMKDNHNLTVFVYNLLGSKLIAAEQKVESFVFKTSRTRIIDFLNDLIERQGQRVGYEMQVRNFFTHQEIANITSTSRQTVTTVLNELRNKKILTFNRRRILIRDWNSLRSEAS